MPPLLSLELDNTKILIWLIHRHLFFTYQRMFHRCMWLCQFVQLRYSTKLYIKYISVLRQLA